MSIPDPAIWRDMLAHLRRHHSEHCRQWFEELEPLHLDGGVLEIRVNNSIQRNYLTKRCTTLFNEAAQSVTGTLLAVSFVDGQELEARPKVAAMPALASVATLAAPVTLPPAPRFVSSTANSPSPVHFDGSEHIVLSPDYTFQNFVTGPDNQLAYAAAIAVAEQLGKAYNPFFVHGGVGLGKTHLLQAICQTVLQNQPEAKICYLSCDTFVNQFMESIQNGQMNEFRNRYRHVDLLLIDDIHFLTNRERTQEEFFHTFNTLYQGNKQIVLSSDSPPNEIPELEERLVSRFNWGLVARVEKPCYETRIAILKKKAKLRGLQVPDDVVCYIAGKLDSNIRELEGAITKVQSLSLLRQSSIDMSLARQALDDQPVASAPQYTIQNIIDAVTNYYGVKLADLQSKRRHRSITVPRQICMFLARKRTRYSLEEIGGYFGGRDHTTVMHAIRTTEDRIHGESTFAHQIQAIDQQLTHVSA